MEILKLTDGDVDHPFIIHAEMSAANLIAFDLNFGDIKLYHEAITDICQVAPHMMELDGDLQEAYDDAFRTRPKREDVVAVKTFLQKYQGKIEPDINYFFE